MSLDQPAGQTPEPEAIKPVAIELEATQTESIWQDVPSSVTPQASANTASSAIVALVLSIVTWLVLPIVLAIVALVFARKAEREIAGSQGRVDGGNLVTAAKILSWINIGFFSALLVLGILAVFFLVLAGVASN